jgi:tRNA-splicing ligase RtcB (3'-phosphate/5'-hydroxy nucleic acid ligase)
MMGRITNLDSTRVPRRFPPSAWLANWSVAKEAIKKDSTMADNRYEGPLEKVNDYCWRIPKSYKPGMRVDGLIYADANLLEMIRSDPAPEQVANVAFLPGIQRASLAMPDIHWGYGFPIGGVCATDPEAGGVISPGGVGYDINCGVRLVRSNLFRKAVQPKLKSLVQALFESVPTGVGQGGKYHFNHKELLDMMAGGPRYLLDWGLAVERDIEYTEAHGCLDGAKPENVSLRALDRGRDQCGSLGAGNHFWRWTMSKRCSTNKRPRPWG